jgi:hypothetical protein
VKKYFFLIVLTASFSCCAEPNILIKIPTRSRPEQFFRVLDLFYEKLSGTLPYHFVISCDEDDETMNNPMVKEKMQQYAHLTCTFHKNQSKIEAYNCDIADQDFDIVIVASDDMEPQIKGYDLIVAKKMAECFPDFDGVLHFNDGYVNSQCNTLPIMGRKFYDRFGYVYNPFYKSLVCDVELTLVSRMLGKEALFEQVIILHNHPANNCSLKLDQLYIKNNRWHNYDLKVFYARRNVFFGINQESLSTKQWSILLYSKKNNVQQLKYLCSKLKEQIRKLDLAEKIEILVDDSGSADVGFKRNFLLGKSSGLYVNFLDDSVMDIEASYVGATYNSILQKPDCVELITKEKSTDKNIIYSTRALTAKSKKTAKYLAPTPFNVIKRSIASLFSFFDKDDNNSFWIDDLNKSGYLTREAEVETIGLYF